MRNEFQNPNVFREKSTRKMEKYTGLFHEGAQTSKIAQIRARWTETEKIYVLRPFVIPHANGGKQKVSTIVTLRINETVVREP